MTRPLVQVAEVALGRQRSPEHEQGRYLTRYLRSANIADGFVVLDDVKRMNFTPREQGVFALRAGDVLVTEGSGSRDTVGASAVWQDDLPGVVCFQNTLLRIRPRAGESDGRYLAWWARHAHASRLMAAVASGANILHLSAEELRRLPVPDIPVAEQRRIADFLDDQVARIDNIRNARSKQRQLLAESCDAEIDTLVWTGRESVPLKYLVGPITSGPRGWGNFVGDTGRYFLRIGNLPRRGISLVTSQLARVEVSESAEVRRASVEIGDVLVGITASLCDVALVGDGFAGATFSQHVARLRPIRGVTDPEWLAWAMQSRRVRDALTTNGYGGTKVGLGLAEVANVTVPRADAHTQGRVVRDARHVWSRHESLRSSLASSGSSLEELKRSLITAAVMGEFDVSTADGSRVAP